MDCGGGRDDPDELGIVSPDSDKTRWEGGGDLVGKRDDNAAAPNTRKGNLPDRSRCFSSAAIPARHGHSCLDRENPPVLILRLIGEQAHGPRLIFRVEFRLRGRRQDRARSLDSPLDGRDPTVFTFLWNKESEIPFRLQSPDWVVGSFGSGCFLNYEYLVLQRELCIKERLGAHFANRDDRPRREERRGEICDERLARRRVSLQIGLKRALQAPRVEDQEHQSSVFLFTNRAEEPAVPNEPFQEIRCG